MLYDLCRLALLSSPWGRLPDSRLLPALFPAILQAACGWCSNDALHWPLTAASLAAQAQSKAKAVCTKLATPG
jgi:hypothetical protein